MSYDLNVYTSSARRGAALAGLVDGLRELRAATVRDDSVTVVRGQRGTYCCDMAGPFAVNALDVPGEVTAPVLGARWLYTVTMADGASPGIPHAVRLARHLAQQLDGAVVDRQEGTVWSRSKARRGHRPARDARISTIGVEWYCLREDLASDPARLFCSAAARLLPEALPRRFTHGGQQVSYAGVGADGVSAAWHDAELGLFFEGSGPVLHGYLPDAPGDSPRDRFWRMRLDCYADPFADDRWRDALQAFFITLADELPAIYATAQVVRGWQWSGRGTLSDQEPGKEPPENTCSLNWDGRWHGLSPIPVWWEWFGPPYQDLVRGYVPDGGTATATGLLQEWADHPANRDELTATAARSLPADLLAVLRPGRQRTRPYPLITAARIPASLAEHNPRPTIQPTGTSLADWSDYEVYSPWAWGPWHTLPRQDARQLYNKLMADKPARLDMLRRLLAASGITLDDTDEGIQALNDWLVTHVEPSTTTPGVLSPAWYSVVGDIALFLGDVIIARCPGLRWTLHTGGKRTVSYQQPVLTGFAEWPQIEMNPGRQVSTYAHQIISCRGSIRQEGTITVKGVELDLSALAREHQPQADEIYADEFVQTVRGQVARGAAERDS